MRKSGLSELLILGVVTVSLFSVLESRKNTKNNYGYNPMSGACKTYGKCINDIAEMFHVICLRNIMKNYI